MLISRWQRLLAAVMVYILVLPGLAWPQAGPNPSLVEAAKKEGQLVYYRFC